jgi:glycyl-tRNA synthetase beta chain
MKSRPFLWEIGCEEMPADWLPGLLEELRDGFDGRIRELGIGGSEVEVYGTSRRLVVHVPKLPVRQLDRREVNTGPPARIARTESGEWSQAALGFAKKNEVDIKKLTVIETPKGKYVGFVRKVKGQSTSKLLPDLMAATLRSLSFPKFMNWDAEIPDGKGAFAFGRPIRWIMCIFGKRVVPFEIRVGTEKVKASSKTRGHRFLAPNQSRPGSVFTVSSFRQYKSALKRHFVLVDPEERRKRLENEIRKLEKKVGAKRPSGGEKLSTRYLADLVEWPGVVLGSYPKEFSSLPRDVRHTVLIHHQKYLPLQRKSSFIAVTNMSSDPKRYIRKGSERVVVARLRDAKFFWDEDLRIELEDRKGSLAGVLFHEKLGSYELKTERLAPLGRWIAERCGVATPPVERAALLCKCDLTTGMVGEFPELQGVIGGLYAREQGEPEEVWKAVYSHYRPAGLGEADDFPQNPEGAVVSLADKVDTLAGMFSVGVTPTGSRDPYGLRRAALGIVRVLLEVEQRLGVALGLKPRDLLNQALTLVAEQLAGNVESGCTVALQDFFTERLRFAFGRSYRYDEVNAVFALGPLDYAPLELSRRLDAVASLRDSDDFEALSVAFKRVRNILSGQAPGAVDTEAFTEEAERRLWESFQAVKPKASELLAKGKYEKALRILSGLRPEVDSFFDKVLVMAPEPKLRENRLALLSSLDALFAQVADLSELVAGPR